ncbi:NADPH:quinone oxidoreductase family protein [Mycolicibacterium sp.]|uniref:NADPH:quinone oxidoreductase family protein n=1 Tax=Mycolicibacterium sp. TaxID=2320850 RepID=UPI003560C72A
MKACVVQELSGPSGMSYTDVPDVTPAPDQVVIDVRAAGVCYPDLLLTKGAYQLKLEPPFIPGMEVAGVVAAAPDGSGWSVGDRVSASSGIAGYAEQVAVPVASVSASPPELDDAEAVSLLVNYNTMYFAYARRAALQPGETVLVLGSAGGVGTAAIQIAKAMGARVIAAVNRESAVDFVSSLGPDAVIPLTEGWAQAVRDATEGRGVDVVVDPVGGAPFDDAVRTMATDGRLLVIGFAAGGIPTIKVNRLLLRNVGILGVGYGEYIRRHPETVDMVATGLAALVAGGMKPPAPVRFPLAEASAALQLLDDGGVFGKLVLEP